jgi:hypothetical protein
MRPRDAVGKLLDEGGGRDRARLAPANVLDVSDVRLDLPRVLLIEWQLPELLAHITPGRD